MIKVLNRIAVVGNIAAGKTRLSKGLQLRYQLPLTHVDSIQFLPGMKIRPLIETREVLKLITNEERWLIDGYGPLDLIEKRFAAADIVVFIDLPLWRHRWWLIKRQISNLWSRRSELPQGCNELSWVHMRKLWQTLHSSHRQMRPELLRIFAQEDMRHKVLIIKTMNEWRKIETDIYAGLKSPLTKHP